jgi:hypothetical protein
MLPILLQEFSYCLILQRQSSSEFPCSVPNRLAEIITFFGGEDDVLWHRYALSTNCKPRLRGIECNSGIKLVRILLQFYFHKYSKLIHS